MLKYLKTLNLVIKSSATPLSFFKVVVNTGDKNDIGDKNSVGGKDSIRSKDNIRDKSSTRDKKSLVIILITFITLLNHLLRNYRYLYS